MIIRANSKWYICLYFHLYTPGTIQSALNNWSPWDIPLTRWTGLRPEFCSEAVGLQVLLLRLMPFTHSPHPAPLPRCNQELPLGHSCVWFHAWGVYVFSVQGPGILLSVSINHESLLTPPSLVLFTFLLATGKESHVQLLVLNLNGSQNYAGFNFLMHTFHPSKEFWWMWSLSLSVLWEGGRGLKFNPRSYVHVSETMVNGWKLVISVTPGPHRLQSAWPVALEKWSKCLWSS